MISLINGHPDYVPQVMQT